MEGHSSFPDAEQHQWVGEPLVRLIEQQVTDPATDNHAERTVEYEIVDPVAGPGEIRPSGRSPLQEIPGGGKSDKVQDAVPVD